MYYSYLSQPFLTLIMQSLKTAIITLALLACGAAATAQKSLTDLLFNKECRFDSLDYSHLRSPRQVTPLIDREDFDDIISQPHRYYNSALPQFLGPAVYDTYELLDSLNLENTDRAEFTDAFQWIDDYNESYRLLQHVRQNYIFGNPSQIRYSIATLPEPPKSYRTYVDPITTDIVVEEINVNPEETPLDIVADIKYKKWIHDFNASLQFSQAYISPNWYQGGNNNLNMISQLLWHIKLNQEFYPKVLFETTVQYKLALNSAPDDSIHSINITDDILQINSTFGLKAAKRWYYSATLLFKTQLFTSYPSNSHSVKSAFMAPGELNLGLGMTYNYESPKKNFTFGASLSPLSWNLKTCLDGRVSPASCGIDNGRKTMNKFGSSAELTWMWKIAYNIVYNSRLFAFTDYDKFQGDWEHTINFNINKFLSTRFYLHMRYDTETPRPADSDKWHKFQLKEIFSFGFAYQFGA